MKSENSLSELIKKYNQLKEKYNLPEFSELNETFDIEEIDSETELILRKIRKNIGEKMANYSRFTEIILNPSNAPIFFFKILKKLDNADKDSLSKIYEILGNYELKSLSLDIDYNEKNEAEFIKESYNIFNKNIKNELLKIIEKLNSPEENSQKINGSYFG